MDKKIRCMIRLDDITPDMDWERFEQAKNIFEKYNIKPLIGVVPCCKDETLHKQEIRNDFWEQIRGLQEEGWRVAQHGTYHCYETQDSGILGINPFSEFAGISYEEQYAKLREGKRILEEKGIVTEVFMAPGHTYDKNTIRALDALGFCAVTDGLFYRPYRMGRIVCIPCRLRGFRVPNRVDTVCLHTNLMSDKDMKQLEDFCKRNKEVIVPFELFLNEKRVGQRTVWVIVYEKTVLVVRRMKNRIANSKRLAWYMSKTDHRNSKAKWIKRVICLPMLFFYRKEG